VTATLTGTGSRRTAPPALRSLVGEARAAIIAALAKPRTTGAVAAAVGISSSTASEHLCALNRCGIVSRARRGRFVYYELNARGVALVNLLGEPSLETVEQHAPDGRPAHAVASADAS
jgi:DNA-binding transcriptional ArsR family regulator